MPQTAPLRFLCHGRPTLKVAVRYGWLPGARYTNLRDVAGFEVVGFVDIDWRLYDFRRHLNAVKAVRPLFTVAQDVEDVSELPRILDQAYELSNWCKSVVIVPKDPLFIKKENDVIPKLFVLGYSVPTRYGGTLVPTAWFGRRSVHLLGGRPDVQYSLRKALKITSLDGNRFTLDASYGDYFDGNKFKRHRNGGYYSCIEASLKNINQMWISA